MFYEYDPQGTQAAQEAKEHAEHLANEAYKGAGHYTAIYYPDREETSRENIRATITAASPQALAATLSAITTGLQGAGWYLNTLEKRTAYLAEQDLLTIAARENVFYNHA